MSGRYEAVIFDLDGTLIDSPKLWESAYRSVLHPLGIEFTPDQFRHLYPTGTPFTEWAKVLGIEADLVQDIRMKRDEKYEELLASETALFADAEIALATLAHLPKAIVTGSHRSYIDAFRSRVQLNVITDIVITEDDVERSKPDPEGLLKAASALSIAPENCLYIGDQPFDLLAAKSAAMPFALIRRHYTPETFDFSAAEHIHVDLGALSEEILGEY